METYEENRKPEEIERDIERTRTRMAGTLDDLQRRLSPGQMVDEALGYLDEKAGRIGSEVMGTIRDSPVPATMVGVGLAWLFLSGRGNGASRPEHSRYSSRYSSRRRDYGAVGYGSPSAYEGGGSYSLGEKAFTERRLGMERRTATGGSTWTGADRRGGERRTGRGAGRGMGARMGESIGEAGQAMGEAVDTAKRKASETASGVSQKAGRVLGEAREKASEWTEEAREKASEWTEDAREQARWAGQKVREQTRYVIEEQPLVLGALGIAIGAAIGASLPRTRPEDEFMGETRDELLHRADETGGEVIREVREQVKSGTESLVSGAKEKVGQMERAMTERERAESGQAKAGGSPGDVLAGQHSGPGGMGTAGGGTPGTSTGVGSTTTTATTAATGMGQPIPATPGGEKRRP
jgi:ElaB/YqjD/DUF883 family membrane-anchored ribosome-binding protein